MTGDCGPDDDNDYPECCTSCDLRRELSMKPLPFYDERTQFVACLPCVSEHGLSGLREWASGFPSIAELTAAATPPRPQERGYFMDGDWGM